MKKMTHKKINVEGILLPNEPLTNIQLIEAAKKLKLKNFKAFLLDMN